MAYDGQSYEGLRTFDHEDRDLLFTELVSRNVHRLRNPKPGDLQHIGALLTHLTELSEITESVRADHLLDRLTDELPTTPESVTALVAGHQVRDKSGLAVDYDQTVGMIYRVTAR